MAEEPSFSKNFPTKSRLKPTSKKRRSSPESKYWKSFKTQQISGLVSSITSIDFSPCPPHLFAVTHSASLSIYNSHHPDSPRQPVSTISAFTDVAYSASFRSDGKLIAAGGESGIIQVFETKSRNPLRQLRGHSRPVRLVKYPRIDRLHLFSGGDDSVVKYWDVAAEAQLNDFLGHKDYVRSGCGSPVDDNVFITGSYDHTVRVWDVRGSNSESSTMVINHGKPVEDAVFLPSGGLIATAGGNVVKIWDVIGGGKCVYSMESHNKTVTSVCVGKVGRDTGEESEQYRLLSVSLDGYLKVFDYSKLKITFSVRFLQPLLSVGFSPDCSTRVIGTSNGIIYMGKRKTAIKEEPTAGGFVGFHFMEEPQRRVLRPSNFRYFHRGQSEKPSKGDFVVLRPKKVKLAEHDKLLKKFRHKDAFVSALRKKNPENVMAVIEELVARKKLLKCVTNLDMEELEELLMFFQKYSAQPRYSGLLMQFAIKVLQIRAEDIQASETLIGHARNLKRSIDEEIRIQQSLLEIQGIISPIMRIAGRR
ncbi:hypothetical protein Nepgr_004494 [Nepenthes gracilis]|uniref:U3 small nucleolar RNA-associated protein 15 C-terminal domain-containing protein n=1 Tax=Nepenthes gracilis TaxID=150966 RepID=A0AAD3XFB9_NEPGR|nr:hypothetical protein Nepgr_004494 [Nepenthes gracilis]